MKKIICSLVFMFAAFALSTSAFAQSIIVRGTVTDANTGEILVGASVTVVGTKIGTVTNLDGEYCLSAPEYSFFAFSMVGYKTAKRMIIGRTLNVELEPEDLPISANSENNVSTQFLKGDKALEFKNDK